MKKFTSKFIGIASALVAGIVFVFTVNTIIDYTTLNSKFNDAEYNKENAKFHHDKDKDMIEFFKYNTISIGFIKNSFEKTSGTAWIKSYDSHKQNFIFSTNLHVADDFIHIEKETNKPIIDPTISLITVKFFNDAMSDKLYLGRTNTAQWTVKQMFVNQEREIPEKFSRHKYVEDNKITNGYMDYVELAFTLESNDDSPFATWLKTKRIRDAQIATESELDDYLKKIKENNARGIKEENYIYAAGFPVMTGKATWIEQKFKISDNARNISYTTSVNEMSVIPWLDREDSVKVWNHKEEEYVHQRSIAKQITFNGLYMGSGSSGSMICAKINDEIKVIAIWWGTYGKKFGAGDLLITNDYVPKKDDSTKWQTWNGYNLVKQD